MDKIEAQWWGEVEYSESVARQVELRDEVIRRGKGGFLVFVEHPPVVTCGRNHEVSQEEIARIRSNGMDFQKSSRGGQLTFHGPGQLVMYPIFHLGWLNLGVKAAVQSITDAMMAWLSKQAIPCVWRDDAPGVWTESLPQRKLASVGMRITRNVTWHGGAINLTTDLSAFSVFQPCGFSGSVMTSVADLTGNFIDPGVAGKGLSQELALLLQQPIVLPDSWASKGPGS